MTTRVGTLSVDGTPISRADLARIEAEEQLHAEQQRRAVQVVAAASHDVEDCRALLSMLGLSTDIVRAARLELAPAPTASTVAPAPAPAAAKRGRKSRAA